MEFLLKPGEMDIEVEDFAGEGEIAGEFFGALDAERVGGSGHEGIIERTENPHFSRRKRARNGAPSEESRNPHSSRTERGLNGPPAGANDIRGRLH